MTAAIGSHTFLLRGLNAHHTCFLLCSSAGDNTDLTFPSPGEENVPKFSVVPTGGPVGAYLRVDGSNSTINVSATSSAALPGHGTGTPGITVEMLLLLPSDGFFNLAGACHCWPASLSHPSAHDCVWRVFTRFSP